MNFLINALKQFILDFIYTFYALFFRKAPPGVPKNEKIAIFFFGQRFDGSIVMPIGEFIIREPFFRFLRKNRNELILITQEQDFMKLPPFNKYFRKIISLEEFLAEKESYDCILLAQNYLALPFKKIKEKTQRIFSISSQGLYSNPVLWKYIDYFPRYYLGNRHELQRTFDIIGVTWDIESVNNIPIISRPKAKKEYIAIAVLDEKNFKALSAATLENVIRQLFFLNKNKIILTGSPDALETSVSLVNSVKNKNLINKVGKTNAQALARIIASSKFVISPDTGTAHLAAALKIPLIVYYTRTVLERWKPLGKDVYQYKVSDSRFKEKIIEKSRQLIKA